MTVNLSHAALALALAALVATATGGVAAVGAELASQPADAQQDDYAIDVVDPDDRLSDADVERAIQLAESSDAVAEHLDGLDVDEVTVQALGDDVTVVFVDEERSVSADVDLAAGSVVEVVPPTNVVPVDESDVDRDLELDGQANVSDGETATFSLTATAADVVSGTIEVLETTADSPIEFDVTESADDGATIEFAA